MSEVDQSIVFKDFLEPHLIKTGHIIPVSAGHNGPMNKTEMTLFEIHLQNAGFIVDFNSDTERALVEDPYGEEEGELTGEPDDENAEVLAGFEGELVEEDNQLVEVADNEN